MNTEDQIIRLLFQRHVKPVLKEVLQDFLNENCLALISTKPANTSGLVSTKEAVRYLGGINRQTLYRYIDEGLPAFRVGRAYKFRIEDIDKFIRSGTSTRPVR